MSRAKVVKEPAACGWGEPPPLPPRGRPPDPWAVSVRANPGSWGWRDFTHAGTASARASKLRRQGFEVTRRGNRLYARWTPAPEVTP